MIIIWVHTCALVCTVWCSSTVDCAEYIYKQLHLARMHTSLYYSVTAHPEDGQAWPKHVGATNWEKHLAVLQLTDKKSTAKYWNVVLTVSVARIVSVINSMWTNYLHSSFTVLLCISAATGSTDCTHWHYVHFKFRPTSLFRNMSHRHMLVLTLTQWSWPEFEMNTISLLI